MAGKTTPSTERLLEEPDDFDDFDPNDCWQCGGDGYIADCFDGFCVNAEDGCALCMRRCDLCAEAQRQRAAALRSLAEEGEKQ